MFLCKECIEKEKVKVNNKGWAIMTIEAGRGSLGPCESCRKVKPCADA